MQTKIRKSIGKIDQYLIILYSTWALSMIRVPSQSVFRKSSSVVKTLLLSTNERAFTTSSLEGLFNLIFSSRRISSSASSSSISTHQVTSLMMLCKFKKFIIILQESCGTRRKYKSNLRSFTNSKTKTLKNLKKILEISCSNWKFQIFHGIRMTLGLFHTLKIRISEIICLKGDKKLFKLQKFEL